MDVRFTNPGLSYVRSQFSESPCDVLYDQNLDGKPFATATGFIPTLRMKNWKPASQQQKLNENNMSTYCYIDNDPSNNKQDILMGNTKCDKSDPLFAHTPFIKSVFSDNKQDRSQNFPFKKCIIEVDNDPSKLSLSNLNTFWTNVEKAECDALFAPLRAENAKLQSEMQDLLQRFDNLRLLVHDIEIDISNLTQEIADLDAAISTMNSKIKFISKSNDELTAELDALSQQWTNMDSDFRLEKQKLDGLNATCQSDTQQTHNDIQALRDKIYANTQIYKSLSQQLAELAANFDTLTRMRDSLYEQKKQLMNDVDGLTSSYSSCETKLASCRDQLTNCSALRDALRAQIPIDQRNLDACMASLFDCIASKNQLQAELDRALEQLRISEALTASLLSQRDECERIDAQKQNTSDELQYIIDNWKTQKYDCSGYLSEIERLKAQIAWILSWCTNQSQIAAQFAQNIITDTLVKQEQASKICQPIKKPLPVLPNSLSGPARYDLTEFLAGYKIYFSWRTLTDHDDNDDLWLTANIGDPFHPMQQLAFNYVLSSHWSFQEFGLPPPGQTLNMASKGSGDKTQTKTSVGVLPYIDNIDEYHCYVFQSPPFRVSQKVTTSVKFVCDDDAYIYINGNLVAFAKYAGGDEQANDSKQFTFLPDTVYVIWIWAGNDDGEGYFRPSEGFDEIADKLLHVK